MTSLGDSKESAHNAEDPGSIPGLGRSPGEGNGNPLQCFHLENPMVRGAWWAIVHGVAKSWTDWMTNIFTFKDNRINNAPSLPSRDFLMMKENKWGLLLFINHWLLQKVGPTDRRTLWVLGSGISGTRLIWSMEEKLRHIMEGMKRQGLE